MKLFLFIVIFLRLVGELVGDLDVLENQVIVGDLGVRGEGEEREGGGEIYNGVGGNNLKLGNDYKKKGLQKGQGYINRKF